MWCSSGTDAWMSESRLGSDIYGAGCTRSEQFIATLSDEQRRKVEYSWNDDQQRARWSNFPTGFVPRWNGCN
jgi:hypothetical protein